MPPKPPAPLLLIVDGSSLLHRAYHALPNLTAPDGRLVNACYGFLTMFLKALVELHPTHVTVTFDLPGGTFRNELFPAYQAQREEKPDELYAQIPMIKEILDALRVPVHEVAGFEADDVIGTIAARVRAPRQQGSRAAGQRRRGGVEPVPSRGEGSRTPPVVPSVIVLTGDKDLLQLVGDGVEVVLFRRGMTETGRYDRDAVIKRFGFGPERIPDFKALAGDPSDNYPGVPGIGEKTATELVKEFGGVEDILQNAKCKMQNAKLSQPFTEKLAQKVCDHAKDLELGLKLATIVRDVPVEFSFNDCARGSYDRDAMVAKLRELGFQSLVARLPEQSPLLEQEGKGELRRGIVTPPYLPLPQGEGGRGATRLTVEVLSDPPAIQRALADARAAGAVVLAVVADEDDPRHGHPRALGLAYAVNQSANIRDISVSAIGGSASGTDISRIRSPLRAVGIHPWGNALAESVALLRDAAIAKDVHDAKALLHALGRSRIEMAGLRYDTELLSYLLAPGSRSHDLAHVAFAELGIEIEQQSSRAAEQQSNVAEGFSPPRGGLKAAATPGGQASGVNGQMSTAAAERAGREAVTVQQLVPILTAKVRDAGLTHVHEDIERPLVPVLYRMETHGIQLDTDHLTSLGKRMRHELDAADHAIHRHAGEEFNIDSPQQLKVILFEKLGLAVRGIKKTAKGKTLSTAASELEKLRGAHPIIEHLFTHRELSKLLSTYVEALPALVDPTTGRVHTTYHQTVTATGRLSSSDPNLQNIPVTEPWGPAIRKAFIAEDGWQLLSLDYSQFELRVAAALSGDRALQKAFRSKQDIHAATGAEVFGVAPEEVTRDQRRVAKAINFGILYGMGAKSLAVTAAVSYEEAEAHIQRYFAAFPELASWIEATKAIAHKRGYVETLFGRKRFLPEIASGVPQVRAAAERMAVNMPIQGTQADLLKMAMIRADEWIRSNGFSPSPRGGARGGGSGERRVLRSFSEGGEGVRRSRRPRADSIRMVLTVHDELVFEVHKKFVADAARALTDILEHVHQLPVPIVVEAKVGPNWADLIRVVE